MSEGRALVFPRAIGFGARALAVPGRGHTLCVSAFFAFRLTDHAPLPPADWYQAVSSHAGPDTIPDTVAPLPGAEILVLGKLDPVGGEEPREARLRCGPIERRLFLQADPDHPGARIPPGPASAVWHAEDNPEGRGGPEDEREPLIVSGDNAETPFWLGSTPFDHPLRLREAGTATSDPAGGWPADARPSILYEAHPALWAEELHPGDPLELAGLAGADVESSLPPYRVTIVSARDDLKIELHAGTRIHAVAVIPSAGIGAVFHRVGIPLGDDILGQSVIMLLAALEDVDSPVREEEEYLAIAGDRWDDPVRQLDDRPLLPAALAATVTLPFDEGIDEALAARREATEAWIANETGIEDVGQIPMPGGMDFAKQFEEAATPEDDASPPDANAVEPIAAAALAESKRRHGGTGFDSEDIEMDTPREPVPRGERLDEEIQSRLASPFGAPQERAIMEQLRAAASPMQDPDEMLAKLASARAMNPYPPLFWPAMDEEEGKKFGEAIAEHLSKGDLGRHIDISSATVDGGTEGIALDGRRFADVLAEETAWVGVEFSTCEFVGGSFANGRMEGCVFEGCVFEKVNLSRATLTGNRFVDCTFRDLVLTDPTWIDCRFDRCVFERINADNAAARDLVFLDGEWSHVYWTDALLVNIQLRGTAMSDVSYIGTHAPHHRFENVKMYRVWGMSKGFPGSVFEEVEIEHCGFINVHFDESKFTRALVAETGFSGAVFKDVSMDPGCRIEDCDFTKATFENTELSGVRFLNCGLADSRWSGAVAQDAWFYGSRLRGVDFKDTVLSRAVFADADIEGVKFQPEQTIGADFRGTVRADPGA